MTTNKGEGVKVGIPIALAANVVCGEDDVAHTINANDSGKTLGKNKRSTVVGIPVLPSEDLEVEDRGFNQRNVIHSPNGISRTIIGCGGGGGYHDGNQPKVAIPVLTPDRIKKRQNGRRMKENGDPSFTLTAQDKHGVAIEIAEATRGGTALRMKETASTYRCRGAKREGEELEPG